MTLRSILPFIASLALTSCTIVDGDDGDDAGDRVDDSADDGGGDPSGDDGDPSDDGDGSDGDSDDSSDGASDIDPRSGVWDYSEYEPVSNDCDIPADYGNAGGGFGLVSNADGTFTVIPDDDTDPFDCIIDGADFNCPDRATERVVIDPGYDATVVGQAMAEGTFSDEENATGRQSAVVDCEGADCPILEAVIGAEFPCNFEVDFVIDWRTGA